MIACTGGEIRFFYLSRSGTARLELVKKQRLEKKDIPSVLISVSFMQCINYIGMKGKARGTLCALVYENEDECIVEIGCICLQDDTATSIALVTNPLCFYGTNMHDTLSTHFNRIRTIKHEDVFCGGITIYILNQLNGTKPFNANPHDFSLCVSNFDNAFSCSPNGPDIFMYDLCMKQNKLLKKVIELHHKRGSNMNRRSNNRSNKKNVSLYVFPICIVM